MNTEKIQTLDVLLDAMDIVENARSIKDLTHDERLELEKTSVLLRKIERSIIKLKTNQLIGSITADAKALNELAIKIENKATNISILANVLKKTAKVVELFVQIVSKTISAGLL